MNESILKNQQFWKILHAWWKELENNRGDRAQLRRARTPEDVFITPAYQRGLVAELKRKKVEVTESDRRLLALPAGVLSHVKVWREEEKGHFARQLAPVDQSMENVCDARFRKLMSLDDRDDLYTMLVRLTRFLKGTVHCRSMVTGAYWWNDTTKHAWAKAYYTINI